MKRKLAAILYADVAGYSRLTDADEEATHMRLDAGLDRLTELVEASGGKKVHEAGDAILAEFESVIAAVQSAINFQIQMSEVNAELDDEDRFEFRIGINLGEVMHDRDDIYGDGVNLAARIQDIADPGGICISGKVFDEVNNKVKCGFDDLGEKQVKNIKNPVRLYRVVFDNTPVRTIKEAKLFKKPAVAVLPFDNLSGDPEQEYFSDGLSEDIITLLSAWRSFPVVARNSSFVFKGQHRDVRQIGLELSARYVIEGSVRKSGDRVRVTAQLIDAETGHHLWAEKFDGLLDDIFEIQDNITLQIVSLVEPQLEEAERNKTATLRSSNLSAWNYYLQGRALLHKLTAEGTVEARQLFEKAIQLDPQYSDAYAGLSYTYQREILLEVTDDRIGWEKKALEAAQRAVELDNGSSLAHLALGGAYIWSNQHELSVAETRTAVERNPSNVLARLALGNRLDIVGKSDEGIPLLKKSLELNPLDPHGHIYFTQLARAYINARDYQNALFYLQESIRRKPEYPHTYHVLAICLGHLDRIEEARDAAAKCEQLHLGFINKRAHWNIYLDAKANEHLTDGLRKAGLVE